MIFFFWGGEAQIFLPGGEGFLFSGGGGSHIQVYTMEEGFPDGTPDFRYKCGAQFVLAKICQNSAFPLAFILTAPLI